MIMCRLRLRSATQAAAALLMASWLPAFAQDAPPPPMGPGRPDMPFAYGMAGPGQDGPHGGGPLSELAKAEADQVASEVIADLSHAGLPDVQRVVRTWGLPTALRYFDVAPQVFHDLTTPRLVALVKAALRDQLIPNAAADRIMQHLQHDGPPPPRPPQ